MTKSGKKNILYLIIIAVLFMPSNISAEEIKAGKAFLISSRYYYETEDAKHKVVLYTMTASQKDVKGSYYPFTTTQIPVESRKDLDFSLRYVDGRLIFESNFGGIYQTMDLDDPHAFTRTRKGKKVTYLLTYEYGSGTAPGETGKFPTIHFEKGTKFVLIMK